MPLLEVVALMPEPDSERNQEEAPGDVAGQKGPDHVVPRVGVARATLAGGNEATEVFLPELLHDEVIAGGRDGRGVPRSGDDDREQATGDEMHVAQAPEVAPAGEVDDGHQPG